MMNEKRKFLSLFTLLLIMIAILAITSGIMSYSNYFTSTRYIKREKDEIKAYYSSLYLDGTGDGHGIAIENNVGYASFELRNYIGEDVTKRDIEYNIKTVSQFYGADGNILESPADKDLYVLDLWNEPTKIGNDTYKYEINVESNSGKTTAAGNYLFEYEERGKSAVGKNHKITIKLQRKTKIGSTNISDISDNENISIVVQVIKPYKTIYVIDMYVSNRLIVFSNLDTDKFETTFKTLQIQTVDNFSYTYKASENATLVESKQTAKAFKVTLTWDGLILNENMLKNIHNNVLDLLGTTNADNLDISKPYIVELTQGKTTEKFKDVRDDGSSVDVSGRLVIYVPQSSNFSLNFLPIADTYFVDAKVEIYRDDLTKYEYYNKTNYSGHPLDANGIMNVIKNESQEGGGTSEQK